MCGIAGIFRFQSDRPVNERELSQMTDLIAHRGPDSSGVFVDGCFGFAHRRLSIIDVSARASQPMSSADGHLHISFNGEIYNYVELAEELKAKGVVLRTRSDTEVLLEMFRAYGPNCLKRLNGMFAFAIWDSRRRSLFLARDHVGIKPLYLAQHDEGLIFSSEIKAILVDQSTKREANRETLDAYLRFGYVPGNQTMFAGIERLPPGHFLTIENGQLTKKCYWDVQYAEPDAMTESEYVERADYLMRDAVKLQLRSDVPLGVFLSGGVDSSAIVALTQSHGERDLNTYSIGWDYGKDFDESKYARQIAEQFGTRHHELWMTAEKFREGLDVYSWLMDEPVTEAAAVSLYKISELARKDVTVVLSGEGSDEVFGGYPIYLFMQLVDHYRRLPAPARQYLLNPVLSLMGEKARKYINISNLPLESTYMGVSFYDRDSTHGLLSPDARQIVESYPVSNIVESYFDKTIGEHTQRRMQYLDLKTWLVDDLLIKADRMTMGASQELRVPFLDYRLLEFAAKLPPALRTKKMQPKYLMKKAVEKYLPKDVIYRSKRGFPTPLAQLFRNELRGDLEDSLRSQGFRERGLFDNHKVDNLLAEHAGYKADHHRTLWQLLVLEKWYATFIDTIDLQAARPGGF